MKRHTITALAAALCLLCTGIPAGAAFPETALTASAAEEALTYDVFTYEVEGDHIIITKCDDTAESVTIPSKIDGKPVTVIGATSFYGCKLKEVEIPEGVTTIKSGAFWHSKSLTTVKLPSTLTTIEGSAFNDCTLLANIDIPKSVTTIGNAAFADTAWFAAQKEASPYVIANGILLDASAKVEQTLAEIEEEKERAAKAAEEAKIWHRANIITNQIAYFPNMKKQATYVAGGDTAADFELVDAGGKVVFTGTTTPGGFDAASGDTVQTIDFTAFKTEGTYTLRIGEDSSRPFVIGGQDLYSGLLYDGLNYFYQARSGVPIEAQYITSGDKDALARNAGHAPDVATIQNILDFDSDSGTQDVTGGWYDAGDHGKYVVNGGISLWLMQNQYERAALKGTDAAYADGAMPIPENANGNPDLLDEARFEMEWMLKMMVQKGDMEGMAYHKVTDSKWTALGLNPANDMESRWLLPPSTAATLNLSACAAQSYRLWKDLDPVFAGECLAAAKKSYEAAKAHPDVYAPNKEYGGGGAYNDDNVTDEFYWAAAELYVSTGDKAYYDDLKASDWAFVVPVDMNGVGENSFTGVFDWGHVGALGSMTLLLHPEVLTESENTALNDSLKTTADAYLGFEAQEGYGVPFTANEDGYPWGSNSFIADNAVILGYAYDATQDAAYLDGMLGAFDYILGRNPLDFSYVTGYGVHSAQYPHHRWWAISLKDGYPKAPCGVLVGGPNSGRQDPVVQKAKWDTHLAPQLSYLDDIEAYSVNEVTINWNTPLTWVTSFLLEQNGGILVSEPSHGVQIPEPEKPAYDDPDYVQPVEIELPEGITAIGEQIFGRRGEVVTKVTVPEGVTSIGKDAFTRCKLLSDISLPSTLSMVGDNAFAGTPWLAAKLEESPLLIMNGLVIDGKNCEGDVVIPDGVTAILGSAFSVNDKITSVTIPESVTSIGDNAFYECKSLTDAKLPENLKTIGKNAFNGAGLTSLTIPKNVESVGELAFANTPNLTEATVKGASTIIGKEALGWTSTFTLTGQYAYVFVDLPVDGFVLNCLEGSQAAAYAGASSVQTNYIGGAKLADNAGDLTGDGMVNASDASQLLIACAEIGAGNPDILTSAQSAAADVDVNGEINAGDATVILQYAAYTGAGGTDSFIDYLKSK